ncbi:class I SAM-dependent methyltransferase [Nonomuraea longicatena]|uniref:Class I SAM-dependent methyltransferase n=1 Tax=Nonomuraea longicatena TaxID=83682 RepID=A0ABN1PE08_9ACTN
MDLDAFHELLTPRGQKALAEAAELVGGDPVKAVTRLRRSYDSTLTSAALTQAALRDRARAKFADDAARMYFTPNGLEQATRPEVAAHRARSVIERVTERAGPSQQVVDVCCGIGGDAVALAGAGHRVDAVELDPLTAEVARANVAALGLDHLVTVTVGDAAAVAPEEYDVLFADPARRTARGRTFDPRAYSPPWPVVTDLVARARRSCLKVAPGIPYDYIPEAAEAEWVSFRGEVKEAALWTPGRVGRRATLLPSGLSLTPSGVSAPTGPLGRYVYEPDGAAIRAHLVGEVAELVNGRLPDPMIAYIAGDDPVDTPWASRYEVHEAMPFSLKRLRAALRAHEIGNVTIKKRGSAVDIDRLRRDLRLSGDKSAVIILTRVMDQPFILICLGPLPA